MPSAAHEIPLQLLHDNPAILSALLRKLGRAAPEGPLVLDDANLRFADPAEVRPDLVFRAERPRWILVELQNRIDPTKARRWILAAAIQLDATGTMGELFVLTSSRRVARWARQVGRLRGELGSVLRLRPVILLIAGETIDALLDEAHPELAFFAAWAVRARRGPQARAVLERATELTDKLPEVLREAAVRAILGVLREPLLRYLREIAMNPEQLPETRAARRFRMFFEERGKVEGKREALLALLGARGVVVSEEARATIAACADEARLDGWIVRAATARTAAAALRAPRRRAAR
jgi:hypothetical protein